MKANSHLFKHQKHQKPFYRGLFFQVIVAIILGVVLGCVDPEKAIAMQPLGDAFIKLIKMLIAPIIFCTIVSGIAGMGNMKQVGRVGAKAILVFEVITTLALIIGWALVEIIKPGSALNIDMTKYSSDMAKDKIAHASMHSTADFFMSMIPDTLIGAFANGEILQVLLVAILFAWALGALGNKGRDVVSVIDSFSHVFFKMVDIVTLAAPIGAFGAMSYTVGKFGLGALRDLGELIGVFYLAGVIFIVVVLAPIMHFYCRLNTWQFLKFIREELTIILGTSSSETVLPRIMEKLTALGCSKPLVGLVIPAGYSFNLVGSSIYFTMGALFVCYATHTPITFTQELLLFATLLITSKGAAGVSGSAFIVLSATMTSMNLIPKENLMTGLELILAIDRFMSTGRALINLIGNGMTTVMLAKWEGELDHALAVEVLAGRKEPDLSLLEK